MTPSRIAGIRSQSPLLEPDEDWRVDASCTRVDPELFFPLQSNTRDAAMAVSICQACPVIDACRDWVLADDLAHRVIGGPFCIAGGLTPADRKRLRRANSVNGARTSAEPDVPADAEGDAEISDPGHLIDLLS